MRRVIDCDEIDEGEFQRDYERRIMEMRTVTGCFSDDGLYDVTIFETGPIILSLSFVDESCVYVKKDREIRFGFRAEKYSVTPIEMAQKWFDNGGKKWLTDKIRELSEQREAM